MLIEFTKQMETFEYFDEAEYMVIYMNNDVYTTQQADSYLWSEYPIVPTCDSKSSFG